MMNLYLSISSTERETIELLARDNTRAIRCKLIQAIDKTSYLFDYLLKSID